MKPYCHFLVCLLCYSRAWQIDAWLNIKSMRCNLFCKGNFWSFISQFCNLEKTQSTFNGKKSDWKIMNSWHSFGKLVWSAMISWYEFRHDFADPNVKRILWFSSVSFNWGVSLSQSQIISSNLNCTSDYVKCFFRKIRLGEDWSHVSNKILLIATAIKVKWKTFPLQMRILFVFLENIGQSLK